MVLVAIQYDKQNGEIRLVVKFGQRPALAPEVRERKINANYRSFAKLIASRN